ncbi:MAG: hypothetical protein QOK37_4796 [Thermoanaerobaculia bacterium]|nr:hypothetical protein [Thermoanaerobaculia bacterium]
MLDRKLILAMCAAAAVLTVSAFAGQSTDTAPAQTNASPAAAASAPAAVPSTQEGGTPTWIRPETPQQRRDRLGTAEDPGPDPDLKKHWWRYGQEFTIDRYERKWATYDRGDGMVRPMAMVNIPLEIYQQNDRYVWAWVPILDKHPADSTESVAPAPPQKYLEGDIKFLEKARFQFAPLAPAANNTVIRFEDSSEGLPTSGSWRNSLVVADMNGDGCPDIIAPPQRGGASNNLPAIFLGDCKGHWKLWADVIWPHSLDYGGVVAADFNKDGNMDLAFAVHLNGIYVFMGDGKGHFSEVIEGLPRDYATRRIIVTDVNNDGYPDLAAASEGPSIRGTQATPFGKAIVLLNKNKGKAWQVMDIAGPGASTGSDWMSAGNFNGDSTPDFFLGSIYHGSWDVLFLSKGPKLWAPLPSDGDIVPSRAVYVASAAGKFSSKTRDDVVFSFFRDWPADLDTRIVPTPPIKQLIEIDRMTFGEGGPKRVPIARWSGSRVVTGLASGDFNGDGKLDIIYRYTTPANSEAVILLGDGKGGFTQAKVEGLPILDLTSYDLKVADVDGDGKPDVIIMYESGSKSSFESQNGSIRVFLNRGASGVAAVTKSAETRK